MSAHIKIITFILLLPLLLLAEHAYSQNDVTKIYLKDGTILEGYVIADNDRYVELIKLSNDTIQVGYKHISSVGKPPKNYKVKRDKILKKSGIAITAMGNIMHDFGLSQDFISPELTISKRLNQGKYNIGISLAYNPYTFVSNFNPLESNFLSAAAYGRYYLIQKKVRILVDGKIGYSYALEEMEVSRLIHDYNGEIVSALGMGVHIPSNWKISMLIRAGVHHLKTNGVFSFSTNGNNSTAYSRKLIYPYVGIALEF